ncbi:MAG: hypothetical protein ACREDS_13540 [Limisphaerales bacterium]
MNPAFIILVVFLTAASIQAQSSVQIVWAKIRVTSPWKDYPTRTLSDLPKNATDKTDSGLSQFGGLLARKVQATGFFYSTNIDGRWWLIDPQGCLFLPIQIRIVRQ